MKTKLRSRPFMRWFQPTEAWVDLFWSKVDRSKGPDACWQWTGHVGTTGYGQMMVSAPHLPCGKTAVKAHRAAFVLSGGRVTKAKPQVNHQCEDNPLCCNPAHLYAGDQTANIRDMLNQGRHGFWLHPDRPARGDHNGARLYPERLTRGDAHWSRHHPERVPRGDKHWSKTRPDQVLRGESNGRAKLTWTQVLEIRSLASAKVSREEIAKLYPVNESTVSKIVRGEIWKKPNCPAITPPAGGFLTDDENE